MRPRAAAMIGLAVTAAALGGCVYDPYTGFLGPCCGYYGYGYGYRYPEPYYPYGYPPGPYGTPQAPQAGPTQGPAGAAAYPAQGGTLAQRFAAANVTRDGRLTRQQAEAGMPLVAQNFDAIDIDRKGYLTLPEVRAFIVRLQAAGGGQPGQFGSE